MLSVQLRRLIVMTLILPVMTAFSGVVYSKPITVRTELVFNEQDLNKVYLAGISAGQERNALIMGLTWTKQSSIFQPVWFLGLEGKRDLLREPLDLVRTENENGELSYLLLKTIKPQTGHKYESTVSYSPKTGFLSISLLDMTTGESLYRKQLRMNTCDHLLSESNVCRESVAVDTYDYYVPIGLEWRFVDSDTDDHHSARMLSNQQNLNLEAEVPNGTLTGKLQVVVTEQDGSIHIYAPSIENDKASVPISRFPSGSLHLMMEYLAGTERWVLSEKDVVIIQSLIDVNIADLRQTEDGFVGVCIVTSDSNLAGLGLRLTATISGMTDKSRQVIGKDIVLVDTTVDLAGHPVSLTFETNVSSNDHLFLFEFTAATDNEDTFVRLNERESYVVSVDSLLNFENEQKDKLSRGGDFIEINPVILPDGDRLVGDNWHFGWPVATKIDDTIIVAFQRGPKHWEGRRSGDQYTSASVITRSVDGGKTWSEPVDLRQFINRPTEGCRAGMRAIGTIGDGAIIYISSDGVFRSEDKGLTWEHFSEAFGENQLFGPRTNLGPSIVEHPQYGLLVFGHTTEGTMANGNPRIADEIWIRYSHDGGRTWREGKTDVPSFAKPVEPTVLFSDSHMFILARSHSDESYEAEKETWRYVQLWSETGWIPFKAALTNICASDTESWTHSRFQGPWCQDTPDLSINPLNGRLEAIVTNRCGGGQSEEGIQSHMTLNLWSIEPQELLAGNAEWRFEGTLIRRKGIVSRGVPDELAADGMHPAGAVIDEKRGVQHIFIYSGYPTGPSGIFMVTRSLDTESLSKWLLQP